MRNSLRGDNNSNNVSYNNKNRHYWELENSKLCTTPLSCLTSFNRSYHELRDALATDSYRAGDRLRELVSAFTRPSPDSVRLRTMGQAHQVMYMGRKHGGRRP